MDTPQTNDQIHAQIGDNASGIAVGKQITQNVTQHFYHQPAPTTDPTLDFAAVEQRYRDQVVKYYNKLALTGLPERDPGLHEIALEQIFIKLNIALPQPAGADFLGFDDEDGPSGDRSTVSSAVEHKRHMRAMARRRPTPVTLSVAEALQRHTQLTIIGGPGSGKTTLTRWLAVIFARREQAKPENLGAALAGDRLPIMLELRRFAEHFVTLSQQPVVPDLASEIANFISRHAYYPDTPAAFIQQALTDGRCLLLLDGLDEIADLGARQLLTDAVHSFIQHPTQLYRNNLLLVTSRPHGYQSISLSAFQECEVKPFTLDDVALFIRHWYATAYPDQEQSEVTDLTTAIEANARVGELATNPLLCTIIAIVYRNNRVLPNRRVELYLKCCEALLDTWERNKALKTAGLIAGYDWQTKLELLAPVAYWLHNEAERLAAPEADFVKQLAQVLIDRKLGDPAKAAQEARQFITLIRDRSGLLQGRGDGTLEFTHRTFQEYLAARHIAAQPYPDYIDWVMVHLHEAWWREVHLLVIGYLGSSSENAQKASNLIEQLLRVYPLPHSLLRSSFPLNAGLLTHILRLLLGRLWPSWQWQRRLAWVHGRELVFAVQACLGCAPLGLSLTTITHIQIQLLQRIIRLISEIDYFEQSNNLSDNKLAVENVDYLSSLLQELMQKWPATLLPIEILYPALYASDTLTSLATAQILGQFSQFSEIVNAALIPMLKHTSGIVRCEAIAALGRINPVSSKSIGMLLTAFQDSDEFVRGAASEALGKLGQGSTEVVNALLIALQDSDESVHHSAVWALGNLGQGSTEVINALLIALQDPEELVRSAVIRALGNLGQGSTEVVNALLIALQDSDESVHHSAVWALGNLGQGSTEVINALLIALQDSDESVHRAASEALGKLGQGSTEVINALLIALQDPEELVRSAVIRALGNLGQGSTEVINALLIALQDSDEFVRGAASEALGKLGQGSTEVINALLIALQDPEELVRSAVIRALGNLGQGSTEVINALLIALQDSDESVRGAVIRALGNLGQGSTEVINALLIALQDSDESVRGAAVWALGNLGQGSTEVINALLLTLRRHTRFNYTVIVALGCLKIQDPKQLPRILISLNRCLHDSYIHNRPAASVASNRLIERYPLPGYRWTPIRDRIERQRRINQFGWWAWVVCGLVLAALVIVYLSAQLDADSLLVRFGAAVALITGLAAGVAQVLGWTLRNPYGKHEP